MIAEDGEDQELGKLVVYDLTNEICFEEKCINNVCCKPAASSDELNHTKTTYAKLSHAISFD